MQKIALHLKKLFSQKYAGIICLVIAIAAKVLVQLAFFSLAGDKSSQLLAAKNLLEGHGLTINQVFLNDLSFEIYNPLVGWPPGYSVVLTPLLWIFNNDYKTAALVFDIVCVFPFFYYLIRLVNYLNLQKWLKNLFILFAGFFFYPVGPDTSTDLISLTCILAGFYYLLLLMQGHTKPLLLVILISFSLSLAGFFRYIYVPVAFCFPLLLGLAGILNSKKQWIRSSFQIGFILGVLLVSLLIFQHYYTGAAFYVNTRETGFFPENLSKMYPVVPASFFDVERGLSFFSNFSGLSYIKMGKLLGYINYALLIFILVYSICCLWKNKFQLKKDVDYFSFTGIGISLAICFFLFYLSARNSPFLSAYSPIWTYIQEFRYFAFFVLFIQLATLIFLFNRFGELSRFWKMTSAFCALLMIFQFTFRVYSISLLLSSPTPFYSSTIYKTETEAVTKMFKDATNKNTGYETIIASPDHDICNYAALENLKAIYIPDSIAISNPIISSVPAKILVVVPAKMVEGYAALFRNSSFHYYGQTRNQYFYILDVATQPR